ncbi:MAG: hypothetical protein Q8Q32_00390, partial [bacterium]|nr:hypothetical protein [bacterium]
TTKIHPSLRVTVEPDSNEIFPGLAGEESREDTANVSPERPTTNFFLRIFGVNFADSDPAKNSPIHTESAEVRTSTTTFDEVIP